MKSRSLPARRGTPIDSSVCMPRQSVRRGRKSQFPLKGSGFQKSKAPMLALLNGFTPCTTLAWYVQRGVQIVYRAFQIVYEQSLVGRAQGNSDRQLRLYTYNAVFRSYTELFRSYIELFRSYMELCLYSEGQVLHVRHQRVDTLDPQPNPLAPWNPPLRKSRALEPSHLELGCMLVRKVYVRDHHPKVNFLEGGACSQRSHRPTCQSA